MLSFFSKFMIVGGCYFAEEHGGHGLWTFSIANHFEIALSVVLVFGGTHLYCKCIVFSNHNFCLALLFFFFVIN